MQCAGPSSKSHELCGPTRREESDRRKPQNLPWLKKKSRNLVAKMKFLEPPDMKSLGTLTGGEEACP